MDFEKLSIGIGAKLDNVTKIQSDLQAELNNIAKNLSIQVPKIEFSNIANSVKDIQKQLDTIKNTNIKVNTDIGKIDYLKSQNDLINNFGKQSGLSCSKEFNKTFKQGIIDSFNSGDIDKILSDSLKINSNLNDKINKTMSKEATKDLLRQYEGFINEIKGMKISLNNIEFDKSELQKIKDGIRGTLSIDNIKGIGIDRVMDEITDKARKFGFTLDGVIQDKTLQLSQIISQYKDLKKNGISSGISEEDETGTIQKVTMAYMDLIEALEKLEKEKLNTNNIIDNSGIEKVQQQAETIKQLTDGMTTNGKSDVFTIRPDGTKELLKTTEKLNDAYGNSVTITEKLNSKIVTVSENEKTRLKTVEQLANMQNSLNNSTNLRTNILNGDELKNSTNYISELQNKLNSINTDTSEAEIKELENAIKNLSKSDDQLVSLQKKISDFQNSLTNMKTKYGDLVGNKDSVNELKNYQNALENLKKIQSEMASGKAFTGNELKVAYNEATNSVKQLENAIKNSSSAMNIINREAQSFKDSMAKAFQNAGLYVSAYDGIRMFTNGIKEGITTVTEIDTKMRDLKRVADDAPTTALNDFPSKANEMAISLGQTTENAIEATTVWKQLGETWTNSSEILSKNSMTLSNVGDLSAKDSTDALVSSIKAFRMEASDTTKVVDSYNEMGNRFALTTGQIAEGMRIAGATLATAKNDFYQSQAMIGAGTEVMRDSNEVANGVKTISMNLQELKTNKKGDTFLKLQKELKNVADVDLTGFNGELRSTFDILVDLSKKWNDGSLTDIEKMGLMQDIAGKNRVTICSVRTEMCVGHNTYMQVNPKALHHNI